MPRLLVDEKDFRVVETEIAGNVIHVLEVRDGADALGVERWRTFKTDVSKDIRAIFGYMVRVALELEALRDEHRQRIPKQLPESV